MFFLKTIAHKLNKKALLVAGLHFILSFFTDRLMFDYAWLDASSTKQVIRSVETIGVKMIFLLLLVFLWQAVFYIPKVKKTLFFKVFVLYFGCMLVLLLLVWPGIWRMDEFGLLTSAAQLFPHFWQNYITSVFYILSLMLLPFPAGVIVVQCACISGIVARLVTMQAKEGMNRIWILMLPFFMFPVLDSNLYPLRMSLYAFLEVLLIAELFFLWKEKRELSLSGKIFLSLLASIVTVWRTEAIYYVVAYPVLLWMIGRGKKYLKTILIYIIMFVILFMPQKIGEKLTSDHQYELTSIVLPLVPLVQAANEQGDEESRKLLECIDQVVNVEVTLEGAAHGKSGINLFWGEPNFQRTYSSEEFQEFKAAYRQLIGKYPAIFLKERMQTFLDSSDLLENTTELFVAEGVPNYDTFRKYPLSKTWNNGLRTSVIKILEIRGAQYQEKLLLTDVIYSVIPAVLFLLVAASALFMKRRWTVLVLLLTVLVKVPLVFMTAPSRLFMYYYSVYLFGYCVLFYLIYAKVIRIGKKEARKQEQVNV